jgi:hypothetical protein
MTSNEKSLNYKVVDLVESYKFGIEFISVQVHTKKLRFFESRLILIAVGHGGGRLILLNFEIIVYFPKWKK